MSHPSIYRVVLSVYTILTVQGCALFETIEEEPSPGSDEGMDLSVLMPDMSKDQGIIEPPLDATPDADLTDAGADLEDASAHEDMGPPPSIATVLVSAHNAESLEVRVNQPVALHVEARSQQGDVLPCDPTWEVTPHQDGAVSDEGVFEALNTGPIDVHARCGEVSGSLSLLVALPQVEAVGIDLIAWFAADRHVTLDRDLVVEWASADERHNFYPFSTETSPFWRANVAEINDRPVVEFNRAYLDGPAVTIEDDLSLLTVVRSYPSIAENNYILGHCNDSSLPDFGNHMLSFTPSGEYSLYSKATLEKDGERNRSQFNVNTSPSAWQVRTMTINQGSMEYYEGSTLLHESEPESAESVPFRFRFTRLGGWCARGSDKARFAGQMAELLLFRGVLSEDDRASIEAYLMRKYGL